MAKVNGPITRARREVIDWCGSVFRGEPVRVSACEQGVRRMDIAVRERVYGKRTRFDGVQRKRGKR